LAFDLLLAPTVVELEPICQFDQISEGFADMTTFRINTED